MRQDMGRVAGGPRSGIAGGRMWAAVLLACLPLGGCELWEFAQNPTVSFKLPPMAYAISTDDPRWKAPPAAFSEKITCTTAADCCMPPPPGAPPELAIDCAAYSLSCDAGVCATSFPIEVPITIDLAKQVPALKGMTGKVVSNMTLQSLEYLANNQIGVALPPVTLSVAPMRVTSAAGNAEAKALATLPAIDAGAMLMNTIFLEPDAKQAFRGFARDFQTPFNVIATTSVALRSGSPPPQGKVNLTVTGTVTASF
jgi:hypothetical protein